MFLSLEDETGSSNTLSPPQLSTVRANVCHHPLNRGRFANYDNVVSVKQPREAAPAVGGGGGPPPTTFIRSHKNTKVKTF